MDNKRKKRVGIWIRVSTEDQARGESPQHHEARARYYAEAKEWKVVELYDLSGVSGKTVLEHPETIRMIADIKSGHISGLIFSKLARLARNTRELLDISDIFQECGAGLISLQEAIDTTSPAGRLFYTMIAAMAQWEREEISSRVKASVPIRAKLGKPLGGAAPFGYQWVGSELKLEPNEAPVRKLMFELFAQHKRKKTVARLLNEMGHRTRRGKPFADTSINRLLRDPIAKGLRRTNYTQSTDNTKQWKLKPESEWIYTHVEPIVSEELWDECNDFLEAQLQSRRKIGRKPAIHLFAGLTFCSDCTEKMYVLSNSPKYTCKKCRRKIAVDDLEAIYYEQLKDFLLSEDDLNNYLHQADDVISQKTKELTLLETEKRELQKEMDKIYDLYMDDQISKEGFGRKYGPMEMHLEQLDKQIPQLQSDIDLLKISNLSSKQILTEAKDLYSRLPNLSREEQQQLIENITESIIISKDEIAINFTYLPFLSPKEPTDTPPSNSSFPSSVRSGNKATNGHGCVALLPSVTKTAQPPKNTAYPQNLDSLGDHIRTRRLNLELEQKEVAKILQVKKETIWNWENNRNKPEIKYYPSIMNFLQYCPYSRPKTWGEHLKLFRTHKGLTFRQLAKFIEIDPGSLQRWEKSKRKPWKRLILKVEKYFQPTLQSE